MVQLSVRERFMRMVLLRLWWLQWCIRWLLCACTYFMELYSLGRKSRMRSREALAEAS